MAIPFERIESLGINVPDVEQAQELFSRLFGIQFKGFTSGIEPIPREEVDVVAEHVPLKTGTPAELELVAGSKDADPETTAHEPAGVAIDTAGLFELVETADPDSHGVRNIHLKVPDIDAATAEMQENGIRVISSVRVGQMREVIFNRDDLFGIRLCFVEYDEPTLVGSILRDDPSDA
jgi:catechol 2,3-dioxygenase-like lactoylglutathione lyase family enzyme